jgi:hypothetical protein
MDTFMSNRIFKAAQPPSDNYTRHAFRFAGEFDTREAAEQAGFEAGRAEIAAHYDIV